MGQNNLGQNLCGWGMDWRGCLPGTVGPGFSLVPYCSTCHRTSLRWGSVCGSQTHFRVCHPRLIFKHMLVPSYQVNFFFFFKLHLIIHFMVGLQTFMYDIFLPNCRF